MERNNGRYTYIRRQGGSTGGQQQQQDRHNNAPHNQHHSSSSLSSSTSSSSNNSYSSSTNNSNSSSSSLYNNTNNTTNSLMAREPLSQHDELIRYIKEAWTKVNEQNTPVIYCNESDHQLKNFKPFNLEEYWGQRLVQNIHVSHGAGGHQ